MKAKYFFINADGGDRQEGKCRSESRILSTGVYLSSLLLLQANYQGKISLFKKEKKFAPWECLPYIQRMPSCCPPIAYCTNIHSGETWDEIRAAVKEHLPKVREIAGWRDGYFPIGLRLSAIAAQELTLNESARREFADWMEEYRFEVYCINGFPYGSFHGGKVKENVFLPDWSSPERLRYTKQLFLILHEWARPGRDISVSTLPGSHKSFGVDDAALVQPVREMGRFLSRLHQETGRDAHLGFEPEPFGQFDNGEESIAFFHKIFAEQSDEEALRRHLGITYDTCHFALQYESPREAMNLFHQAGIRISRIQASNALALDPGDDSALEKLAAFNEPVYFHQVVVRGLPEGGNKIFADLPEALEWARGTGNRGMEWRCHFHIPLHSSPMPPLRDTSGHLVDIIRYQQEHPAWTPHWEAETYTWNVLPDELKTDIDHQIAGELLWLRTRFEE